MGKPSSPGELDTEAISSGDMSWWTDLEISLVRAFGWSLEDIDRTDIESLIPFLKRLNEAENGIQPVKKKKVYCDQVDWL
jgi:hypothetical protein